MRKLGVFTWFGYRIPFKERVSMIHRAGFETVLHWWDDSFAEAEGFTKEEEAEIIRKEGLIIENAHFQYNQVNDLWVDSIDGESLFNRYMSDIETMAKNKIPVAVMHTTTGWNPPPVSKVGIDRFKRLTERAGKLGVRIAVENVRHPEITEEVLDSIESIGFCYDSGHDFIWSETPYRLLNKYGHRLLAVHLHDNMGVNDDHLSPGEGILNWNIVSEGIEKSAYQDSLTLEGDAAEIPPLRTPEEHLKRLYEGVRARLTIRV